MLEALKKNERADCLSKTTWELPKWGVYIVERWTKYVDWTKFPDQYHINHDEAHQILKDQAESSDEYDEHQWFNIMLNDFIKEVQDRDSWTIGLWNGYSEEWNKKRLRDALIQIFSDLHNEYVEDNIKRWEENNNY